MTPRAAHNEVTIFPTPRGATPPPLAESNFLSVVDGPRVPGTPG